LGIVVSQLKELVTDDEFLRNIDGPLLQHTKQEIDSCDGLKVSYPRLDKWINKCNLQSETYRKAHGIPDKKSKKSST
jgi:hypothetical protein